MTTFLQLLQALEDHLGHIHLPLRAKAKTLPELFDECGLHHELTLTLVRAIYAENRCAHLKDTVSAEPTLRAIAPIRTVVLHADHTDIDTYHFLEAFLVAVQAIFDRHPKPRPAKPEGQRGLLLRFPLMRSRPVR